MVSIQKKFILKKYRAHVINFDECNLIGTHWIDLHMKSDYLTYIDSSRNENIPKEIEKFVKYL